MGAEAIDQTPQGATEKPKLSVIIPAYNEERYILTVLNRIKDVKLDREYEIIVVDDGSRDTTAKRVQEFIDKTPQVQCFLISQNNQGKGGAVRTGINKCSGEVILIQDADLEYNPKDYVQLLETMDQGAWVVYGSRNLMGGGRRHSSFLFYIGGILVTWVTNMLFGSNLTDEATCYKVFRKEIFEEIQFKNNDFSWEPEITAKMLKMNIQIQEVPISYHPRSVKEGKKITWKDGLKAIWVLWNEYKNKN